MSAILKNFVEKRPTWLVFVLAIIVHLLVIGAPFWREAYPPDAADEPRYVFYGESIRAGRGMHAPGYEDKPTAYVMPNLPLMIALIGAESLVRLRIAQLVLCALVAVVVFKLGRSMSGSAAVGWLAVGFLLANLGWLLQPSQILTEPLYTLFLLTAVGLIISRPTDWHFLAGAGAALGMAWLTRGALFGSLVLILIYLGWRVGLRKMVLTGIVMGAVVSPWIIRNYAAFHAFVPTSTQSGNVLAGAYNDEVYKNPWGDGWINPDLIYREQVSEALFNDEVAYSNYQVEQAQKWIRENPDKLPKLMAAHAFGFMRPWFKVARNDAEFLYQLASWCISASLLAYGAWYAWRARHEALIFMLLVILGGFLTGMVFFAIPRYRLPYAPYFALLQAVAVWQIWLRLPKKERASARNGSAAGA